MAIEECVYSELGVATYQRNIDFRRQCAWQEWLLILVHYTTDCSALGRVVDIFGGFNKTGWTTPVGFFSLSINKDPILV